MDKNHYNTEKEFRMPNTDQALRDNGIKFDNETTKEEHIEKVFSYLRKNLECPKGTKMDIKYLWGNNYRVNFWGIKKKETESFIDEKTIEYSQFVIVEKVADGLVHRFKG